MVLEVKKPGPEVRVFDGVESLSHAVAVSVVERIALVVASGRFCSLLLSGGTTPQALYHLLGTEFRDRIPWDQVHLFWGDERWVRPTDPRSNFRMVQEALLSRIAIPAESVHPMPTGLSDPQAGAQAYENTLRGHFAAPWPRFDLVLLGLGQEGHTASLFPGSPALHEPQRWVVAVNAPVEPPLRLTLTLAALNHAALVYFLVTGAEKAPALRDSVAATSRSNAPPPAGMVRPVDGSVIWWIDKSADSLLDKSQG